jgi:hypothetical protein
MPIIRLPSNPFSCSDEPGCRLRVPSAVQQILCHLLYLLSTSTVLFSIQTPIFLWAVILGAVGMFLAMLLLTALCRDRSSILVAIILALLAHLFFLFLYPAAADVDRYIWEGAIQHDGLNPFLITPNDQATLLFRDELWENASFKESTTNYWPFAQLLFLLTTSISEQPLVMKTMINLFDLAALAILLRIAPRQQSQWRFVLLYALNPLVLIFGCGLGHLDPVAAALILAAVACSENARWKTIAGAFLACAIMTKAYTAILIPFILKKTGWKGVISLLAPLPLLLLYASDSTTFLEKPLTFAREYAFNGLLYTILHDLGGISGDATLIILATLLVLSVASILVTVPTVRQASLHVTGVMLLCLPTMHPWYLLLATPFIALTPSKSWLTFHFSVIPLIFFFNPDISQTFFHDLNLLMKLEFIPFLAVAFWEMMSRNRSALSQQ